MSVIPEPVMGTLRWLCGVLDREKIPFQVVGDIAMLLEGASSAVNTVELFVRADSLPQLMRLVQDRITEYPWRRRDEQWDLIMMELINEDVLVAIGISDGARTRVNTSAEWQDVTIDFQASKVVFFEGLKIPIASDAELVLGARSPLPREEPS